MDPANLIESCYWPAPAKLNLFLHIIGRRADGYHLLQTLFQFVDYGDQLRFTVLKGGAIEYTSPIPGVTAQSDLVYRAAQSLQSFSGTDKGARIELIKQLPMGGGLGGGSSDAATTLLVLNQLWDLHLAENQLAQIGLQLGADVPVFVRGVAAWAEGVGEHLQKVALVEPWYAILCPGVHVSTAEIFNSPELTRDARPITIRDYLGGATCNVFEGIVRRRYPVVDEALNWLSSQAKRTARMTGSGSCIFVPVDDESQARAIVEQVPQPWHAFAAQGKNRSPLLAMLNGGQSND